MKLSVCLTLIAGLCISTVAGCGGSGASSRQLKQVSGTVKFDGKPLTQGTITFVTSGNGAVNAAGDIDSSGHYSLSTHEKGDGVPPGDYQVRIESWSTPPSMDEKGVNPGKSAIPEKYSATTSSGLTAKVDSASGTQVINFDLTP